MASSVSKDRLLPSLLDRLNDNEPRKTEEPRSQRAATMVDLRAAVLRDLEYLLNTTNLESTIDLSAFPEIRNSVINYGLPSTAGVTPNDVDRDELVKIITDRIETFEPRILKNTLKVVTVDDLDSAGQGSVVFEVEGTLWGNPMPESLYFRTELDLELGEVSVVEV